MYSAWCPECFQVFSRRDNMLRHQGLKHGQGEKISQACPPPPPPLQGVPPPPPPPQGASAPPQSNQTQQQTAQVQLQHPFTMIVSGPTSCGKTFFVKTLLQNINHKVTPEVQRIVWLFKRWQPLYDVIRATVRPEVEFVQGIPPNLEKDDFFNPKVTNMVILDDLMSLASKDPRISDLFTEGSHHRNLSVIVLNQNLYYNKDPTQRRNCQYLVLFKNPIDKQSIFTLARQMYPTDINYFTKTFEEVTKDPYTYLFIDVKPTTPETDRLKSDIFGSRDLEKTTYADETAAVPHFQPNYPTPQVRETSIDSTNISNGTYSPTLYSENQRGKMASCNDCGLMFQDKWNLKTHMSRWCPEREDRDTYSPPSKRPRFHYELSRGLHDYENEKYCFERFIAGVKEENADLRKQKMDKYIRQGLGEKEAKRKVRRKLKPLDMQELMTEYSRVIHCLVKLQHGNIHSQVMDEVANNLMDGYKLGSAIRMAIKKFEHQLEEFYIDVESDVDSSEESMSEYEEEDEDDSTGSEETDDEEAKGEKENTQVNAFT